MDYGHGGLFIAIKAALEAEFIIPDCLNNKTVTTTLSSRLDSLERGICRWDLQD